MEEIRRGETLGNIYKWNLSNLESSFFGPSGTRTATKDHQFVFLPEILSYYYSHLIKILLGICENTLSNDKICKAIGINKLQMEMHITINLQKLVFFKTLQSAKLFHSAISFIA